MLGFLLLHIISVLFWAASLLYLPALIAGRITRDEKIREPRVPYDSISRAVFTFVATPAALTAIISGTLVFSLNYTTDPWLIVKLTLVTLLVVCHTLAGLLILRAEAENGKPVVPWCVLLGVVSGLLMLMIVWIVLGKPDIEAWLEW